MMIGGGIGVQVSTDGGATWAQSTSSPIHSDQHAVAFSTDGTTVYVGNDGGVFSERRPDRSLTPKSTDVFVGQPQ